MYNKIKSYVSYQLRFDSSSDKNEKIDEITANIFDKYEELLKETNNREQSYIEAIKTMGDFGQENLEKTHDPNIAEMLLLTGTILSVFGLLLTFISTLAGGLVIALSIVSYAVGAMYLYQKSQYIKQEEFDLDKHKHYLTKIFSYLKTNFIFWAIGLSLLITKIVHSLLGTLIVLSSSQSVMDMGDLRNLIILSLFIFVILFVVFLLIFKSYYNKLLTKYYFLTGEKSLEGVHNKAQQFMNEDNMSLSSSEIRKLLNSKYFYVILSILPMVLYFVMFVDGVNSIINSDFSWENDPVLLITQLILGLTLSLTLLVLCIRQMKLKLKRPIIILIANIISIIIMLFLFGFATIGFIYLLILIILLVLDFVIES